MAKITQKLWDQAHADNAEFDALAAAIAHETGVPVETVGVAEVTQASEEVQTEPAETPAEESPVSEPPAAEGESVTFGELVAAVTDEDATNMVHAIATAFDERAAFETVKNPNNDNIHKSLKSSREKMVTKAAAAVMVAAAVDPSFIGRSVHTGSAYNVYAIAKVADVVRGLTEGNKIGNAINLAAMKSLFRLQMNGETMTSEIAKLCACDKIRAKTALKTVLVRHTVSESTASTQASSTMQALTTLGIVTQSGSTRAPSYHLTSNAIVGAIKEQLAA